MVVLVHLCLVLNQRGTQSEVGCLTLTFGYRLLYALPSCGVVYTAGGVVPWTNLVEDLGGVGGGRSCYLSSHGGVPHCG